MENIANWFEIPVADLSRAVRFYEAALATKLKRETFGGAEMAIIGTGGALVADAKRKPSPDGTVVFLHAGKGSAALEAAVSRAREAGGEVVHPITDIGEHGFFALVRDTERNTVGLHAPR